MVDSGHVPNPLRPYYVPPSIGTNATQQHNAATSASKPAPSTGFSFSDIGYTDYIPEASSSMTGSIKSFLDQAVWKYTTVLMAQPFEVAKLLLQTRVAQDDDGEETSRKESSHRAERLEEDNYDYEHSSEDEPNFFTFNGSFEDKSSSRSPIRGRRGGPGTSSSSYNQKSQKSQSASNLLTLKNPHSLLDALSALSTNSGPLSMWRATNSTFVYNVLLRTLETFFRSFLAAIFGVAESDVAVPITSGAIPDSSILASTFPTATIFIATGAAALSAFVLAPIDAARTRLILTPSDQQPRSLLGTLRTLSPAYLIPAHLLPITLLTSTLPTLISTSTPVFLKSYLRLDPAMNPASWSVATFLGSAMDLSIKFPLETVLRRAQIATWTAPSFSPPASSSKRKAVSTIVPVPQAYRGILPTIWDITQEEGFSERPKDKAAALAGKAPRRRRKGQGVEGLYRGWRVGLWGLVGIWGTSFVGGLQSSSDAAAAAEAAGVHGGKF